MRISEKEAAKDNYRKKIEATIWPALVMVFLISLYPLLRYGGSWNPGNDTLIFTIDIRSVLETGELVPVGSPVYASGYGFQALSVFLLQLGGFDLPGWQYHGAILLIAWIVFPAWLLYREWIGSNHGATLATIMLFIQPELVFGIMRGTHEKFTRGLILLCLYLLTYSLRSRHNPVRFGASLLAFYFTTYALITFNNLFATSFITAVVLALGMAWALARRTGSSRAYRVAIRRMSYVVVVSFVLAFFYTFYAYSPARNNLLTLRTITDRVAMLLLDLDQSEPFNPYTGPVFHAWVSPYAFLLLSLANWLLLLGSGSIWITQTIGWFRKRYAAASDAELLQWAFYGSFALQGVLTILADVSGAITGNLQHRMFPTIGLVAAPLITRWLLHVLQSAREPIARLAQAALWVGVGLLSLLSLWKATNEPILSNQWATYLPAEVRAVEWAERNLAARSIWTGFDKRLLEATYIQSGGVPGRVYLDRVDVALETDNYLISDLIRLQVSRLGVTLPTRPDDLLTFDNGQAQIFHRRPRTPYHR